MEFLQLVNHHKRTKRLKLRKNRNPSVGVSKLRATVKFLSNPRNLYDRVEIQLVMFPRTRKSERAILTGNLYCTLRRLRIKNALSGDYSKCQKTAHHLLLPGSRSKMSLGRQKHKGNNYVDAKTSRLNDSKLFDQGTQSVG